MSKESTEQSIPTGDEVESGAEGRARRIVSIRLIVTAATVALISGAVLGVGGFAERNARRALNKEIEARLVMMARNLSELSTSALLSDFPELTLHPLIKELQQKHSELAFVIVLDHEGKVQGHIDARTLGTHYQLPAEIQALEGRTSLEPGESMLASPEILVANCPVTHMNGESIGTALVGLQRSYVERTIKEARKQQAALMTILLAVGVTLAMALMSWLLRPIGAIRAGIERIGRGDLDTPLEIRDRTEFGLLAESMNQMAQELKVAQVEMVEKERLTHEMELARDIQRGLLPSKATVDGDFSILGSNEAAAEVGGDYFDVLSLPDGRLGLAIADVAGKGLGGCLVMSMLAALLRTLRSSHTSPSSLLVALDDQLSVNLRPGVFVTMFYAILDPKKNSLVYASAGHSPVLLYRAAKQELVWEYSDAIPIGAVRGGMLAQTLEDKVLDFEPGDLLVQFTDGVNEAWEPIEKHEFGFARIEKVVGQFAAQGGTAVVGGIRKALAEWTGSLPRMDDETLLVIHRTAQKEGAKPRPGGTGVAQETRLVEEFWKRRQSSPHLAFPADLSKLGMIRRWIQGCPQLNQLSEAEIVVLETGIYELCANIVEHGYGESPSKLVDVWWIPGESSRHVSCSQDQEGVSASRQLLVEQIRQGGFLIRDRGKVFDAAQKSPSDLDKLKDRKRGRGLGLLLIQEIMKKVIYRPSTAAGNITLLKFDPDQHSTRREVQHVATTG